MKAAGQREQKVKVEDGAIRYQLYYREGYERQARQILADGLATYLEKKDKSQREKDCAFANIKPDGDEGGWGAMRLDISD